MTDEFQRGLITGLAMQPLQVTTEHATPDTVVSKSEEVVIGTYGVQRDAIILGDIITIPITDLEV